MKSFEIKARWNKFFERNGHQVLPSASLISPDPSTLFTIAGMVPFIPYMTGLQTPPSQRLTTVQKCLRTLDIDEVGKTNRHITFFQMCGNFSFGDYFKAKAIGYAWDLLTGSSAQGGYGLDPDSIWVTVHQDDSEAGQLWQEIAGLESERIQKLGNKDNFWTTGTAGPGGPCSEIFVDRGPEFGPAGGPAVNEERYMEIWNLVFMQFAVDNVRSKQEFDIVGPLKTQNIDTGLGLERLATLLQQANNIYEIDEIFPVIERASQLTGRKLGQNAAHDVQFRILADHVRSALMIIQDGVAPSNEGRGYVLRRLLRRSVRALKLLGFNEPGLDELFNASFDCMGLSYPELNQNRERIRKVYLAEEEKFRRTLASGTSFFDLAYNKAKQNAADSISAADAFKLHDTHGFPLDLTLEMAKEKGLRVDEAGFRKLMQEQKTRAREDALKKRRVAVDHSAYQQLAKQLAEPSGFTGYDRFEDQVEVMALINHQGPQISLTGPTEFELVLDHTPFYAQGGGQLPDHGTITLDNGTEVQILDVQKPLAGLIVHSAQIAEGSISVGDHGAAAIDAYRRTAISRAHTATHMIHKAMQEELGSQATQAGSEDAPNRLRFDLKSNQAISDDALFRVEQRVNDLLKENLAVSDELMSLTKAREIGAMALFGEKYGDTVRVVRIGGDWSKELCAGTHVKLSGELGVVSIVSEGSIGSGIRRVDALVSTSAVEFQNRERILLNQLNALLKSPPDQMYAKVESLLNKINTMEKRLQRLNRQALFERIPTILAEAETVQGLVLVTAKFDSDFALSDVRELGKELVARQGSTPSVVALFSVDAEPPKLSALVWVNQAAQAAGHNAKTIVHSILKTMGASGGGNADFAQAGGAKIDALDSALAQIRQGLSL
jgi:alanyl-tRNA synthetase